MKVGKGRLKEVMLAFPPGCVGLAGIRLKRDGSHIFPRSPNQWYAWDNEVLKFNDDMVIDDNPLSFHIEGFNNDDSYDHTITISLTISDMQDNAFPLTFPTVQEVEIPENLR